MASKAACPVWATSALAAAGADAIGINCGAGPVACLDALEAMGRPTDAEPARSITPNAGLPQRLDGRFVYAASPEYFRTVTPRLLAAGARIIGGCCGTTPEHIRWMAKSARMLGGGTERSPVVQVRALSEPPVGVEPTPLSERSAFAAKLAAGKFVVSVEVNPAPGLDPTKALEGAKMLLASGVDIVNVADAPRAMARMSNLAFCSLLLERYGIQPILHVCGRDRNLLGQMAHLLGAHAIGIRNLVIITGDPPKVGDYPEATAVYDLDAIGLLQMAANMNRGIDPAGKPLPGGQTSFLLATAAYNAGATAVPGAGFVERTWSGKTDGSSSTCGCN